MLAAMSVAGRTEDTYELRLKLAPDQTLKYQMSVDNASEMMGTNMNYKMSMTMSLATAKAEAGTSVTTKFSDFKMDMDEGSPLASMMDGMKSVIEEMKVTAIYDEFGGATKTKIVSDNPMAKMMAGNIAGAGNSGFLGSIYPKQAIKVGETWKHDMDLGAMLRQDDEEKPAKKSLVTTVYTLSKVEKGVATITSVTKGKGEVSSPMGGDMTITMDVKGTSTVDIATGLLIESTSDGTSQVEMSMGSTTQKIKTKMKRI